MPAHRFLFLAAALAAFSASADAQQVRINGPLGGGTAAATPGGVAGNLQIGEDQKLMLTATQQVMNRDYGGALDTYDRVIALNGSNIQAYIQRAVVKREVKDEAGARADAAMAVRLSEALLRQQPQNARLYYQRGMGYRLLKDFKNARANIEYALSLPGKRADWKNDLNAMALEEKMQ